MTENTTTKADDTDQDEPRSYQSIKRTDAEIRRYGNPSGSLYAYREHDGNTHVTVRESNDYGTRVYRDPATVETPIAGQQRWTIPDNWNLIIKWRRDTIDGGIVYIPESDLHARISIPTNDHVSDAYYRVNEVGKLTADTIGSLASRQELRSLMRADHITDTQADAIEALKDNLDDLESWAIGETLSWVLTDGIAEHRRNDRPAMVDERQRIEFHFDCLKTTEHIQHLLNMDEFDGISSEDLEFLLRDNDMLPDRYRFQLELEGDVKMDTVIEALTSMGASPAAAVDYYMVEIEDRAQTDWAENRGVDQSTVAKNVQAAEKVLHC